MADHDDIERFLTLAEAALGTYAHVAALLEELPVPIVIPELDVMAEGESGECLHALDRARTLVKDEPISTTAQRIYEYMILEWLTVYDFLALTKAAGPAPWRLDIIEYTLNRLITWIEQIDDADELDDES